MKKVSILNKSTLSRHLTATNFNENENINFNKSSQELKFNHDDHNTNLNLNDDTVVIENENEKDFQSTNHIAIFNSHLSTRATTTNTSNTSSNTRLTVMPNSFSEPRRYMYSKAADRSVAINERIERMARKWTSSDSSPCSYDQLSHPGCASPVNTYI